MTLYIVLGVVAVILVCALAMYNSFVILNNKVKEAFATMDVYLKKRWDLIPNMVEIVKGYAKHETETLEKIVELRNSAYGKMSDDQKIEANKNLSAGLGKLLMLAESYPDLKANQNFMDLSNQLAKIEEDIANARKYYNGCVRSFNDKVLMFPSNLIAGMLGYKEKPMFEVEANERENIQVKF